MSNFKKLNSGEYVGIGIHSATMGPLHIELLEEPLHNNEKWRSNYENDWDGDDNGYYPTKKAAIANNTQ